MKPPPTGAGDKPRRRRFLGDPPFRIRFACGFVVGVIGGIVVAINEPDFFPDWWITTTSPWPMVAFVALCGIGCGLVAGFFRRR